MSTFKSRKSRLAVAGFIGGLFAFGCIAGPPQNVVHLKKTYSHAGDTITIEQLRGPSEKWIIGNTYEVRGTYRLTSRDKAMLGAFVSIPSTEQDVHPEVMPDQTVIVSKGEGHFSLRFHLWQNGDPHVSFYPAGGGESLGGVYF